MQGHPETEWGEIVVAAAAAEGAASARDRGVARGDRIQVIRMGIARLGRVEFVSALQILVKWDDGGSSGLRLDRGHRFKLID